jgi:hypothetical protein
MLGSNQQREGIGPDAFKLFATKDGAEQAIVRLGRLQDARTRRIESESGPRWVIQFADGTVLRNKNAGETR